MGKGVIVVISALIVSELAGGVERRQSPAALAQCGVGKTQLAIEFAYRFGRFFPGGFFG